MRSYGHTHAHSARTLIDTHALSHTHAYNNTAYANTQTYMDRNDPYRIQQYNIIRHIHIALLFLLTRPGFDREVDAHTQNTQRTVGQAKALRKHDEAKMV